MGAPPPSCLLLRSFRKAGRCWDPGISNVNFGSPAPGAAGWWQDIVLLLLATGNVGVECSESHAGSPQCWWAWCRSEHVLSAAHGNPWATDSGPCVGHDSLWDGHGSHEQRRTCVLPSSCWRPPHKTAAGSSQNCRPTIAHLGPVARNSLNDA